MIGMAYMAITIVTIWKHHLYKKNEALMTFILILDICLFVVLIGFNGWNWYIASKGRTAIEFWSKPKNKFMKGFDLASDNFY